MEPSVTFRRTEHLTGTWALVRLGLKRDGLRIVWWTSGIAVYWLYCTRAAPAAISESDLQEAGNSLLGGPMGRLLSGPTYGFDALSYDRFLVGSYGLYGLLLTALMSIFIIVRHTRGEEESGRGELVRANVVGRHSLMMAAVLLTLITNIVVSVAVLIVSLTSPLLGLSGALLFAAGLGATGIAFGGVAAVSSQLSAFSRGASGLAGLVVGISFALRALGDMQSAGGNLISWFSPLAWAQQTAPYVLDRWWPLVVTVCFAGATFAAGFILSTRRDFGASLFHVRPGPARAPAWLQSIWTFSFRLQRGSILAWGFSIAVTGILFGIWVDALLESVDDLPDMVIEVMGGHRDIVAAYLGFIALTLAFMAASFLILALQQLRSEEHSSRGELVLAAPVSRSIWLLSHYLVASGAMVAIMLVSGVLTGVGAAIVIGDSVHIWNVTATMLSYIPAILVIGAAAVAFFGVQPRLLWVAWAIFGFTVMVGLFGELLNLPRAFILLSPFEHVAIVSLEPTNFAAMITSVGVAAALVAIGLTGVRRRNIGT